LHAQIFGAASVLFFLREDYRHGLFAHRGLRVLQIVGDGIGKRRADGGELPLGVHGIGAQLRGNGRALVTFIPPPDAELVSFRVGLGGSRVEKPLALAADTRIYQPRFRPALEMADARPGGALFGSLCVCFGCGIGRYLDGRCRQLDWH